jgi:hypothetical protein
MKILIVINIVVSIIACIGWLRYFILLKAYRLLRSEYRRLHATYVDLFRDCKGDNKETLPFGFPIMLLCVCIFAGAITFLFPDKEK